MIGRRRAIEGSVEDGQFGDTCPTLSNADHDVQLHTQTVYGDVQVADQGKAHLGDIVNLQIIENVYVYHALAHSTSFSGVKVTCNVQHGSESIVPNRCHQRASDQGCSA